MFDKRWVIETPVGIRPKGWHVRGVLPRTASTRSRFGTIAAVNKGRQTEVPR